MALYLGENKVSGRGRALDDYSLNEQVIGTWIDGRPLYRKTLEFTTISTSYSLGISTLKNIVRAYGFLTRKDVANIEHIIPSREHDNDARIVLGNIDVSSSSINMIWGNNFNNNNMINKIYLTVEYTKTTD